MLRPSMTHPTPIAASRRSSASYPARRRRQEHDQRLAGLCNGTPRLPLRHPRRDITGPSIPKLFGIHGRAMADDKGCWPIQSRMGIDVMSINLLVENEEDPVVWRGPVIAGAVKQFWTDVVWKDVDFLFVDMPPGTGDVPLTVFQSLPVDGIVVVASRRSW